MYKAGFELDTLEGIPPDAEACVVLTLAQAAFDINRLWLRYHPETPLLYESGVRYRKQNIGADRWLDIPRMLKTRNGSCSDLAPWRAAELNERFGEAAGLGIHSMAMPSPNGSSIFALHHVVVIRAGGVEEDPSALLGMSATSPELCFGRQCITPAITGCYPGRGCW